MTEPRYIPTAAAETLICAVLECVDDDAWDSFIDELRADPEAVIEGVSDILRRFART